MLAKSCDPLQADVVRTTQPLLMTAAECQLILTIRSMNFGSMEIQIQNGIPVFIEKIREKIKLV